MSPLSRPSILALVAIVSTSLAWSAPAFADEATTAPAKKPKGKKGDKPAEPPPEEAPAEPAPEAAAPATPPAEEKKKEGEEEEEDKHHAIYLSGDIGFTRFDVGGISDATGFDKTGANGFLAGIGIGYRHEHLRFGARFREWNTTEYSLWAIMAEVGYGLDMRPIAPALYVHGGYAFDTGVERGAVAGRLPPGNIMTPDVDLRGVIVGAELVASYWFTKFLRAGPFIGFDVSVLHRPRVPQAQSIFPISEDVAGNALFGDSGNGLGYVFSIGLRLTGDVGF